jgi:hypothetical protein
MVGAVGWAERIKSYQIRWWDSPTAAQVPRRPALRIAPARLTTVPASLKIGSGLDLHAVWRCE